MQSFTLLLASLLAITATATPLLDSRQTAPAPAATCPDFGTGFGGTLLLGPTDAQASRCCIYGESLELCCRNAPALATDPYWKNSLACSDPNWATFAKWSDLYHCNIDPKEMCTPLCDTVPYLRDGPKPCPAK
ncbi:hypothetical protein PGQ11_009215 [Apiospora arundinis]|uniref:Uncharacterized protein n=1 Tax=Apiospora arundinis TaxID=335852 RepID=A0ABR2IHX9_9PEZI